MRFRLWRMLSGIAAEADEVGFPLSEGYHACVVGDHDADPDELMAMVRSRLQTDVGRLYLASAQHRPGEWIMAGDEVQGRLISAGDAHAPYDVVVDGRTLSWEEFGSTLEPFEGFRLRLIVEPDE